ncbi:hypothetical protein DICPUDRAFT_95982 [Dictyostelium purpureum]|uniref:Gelsolin-like domain-containing protein n=1 Tax=Dictyostelium purpureum TaxID=5786 RepID=F1A3D7_DICPU|nr:uncharacterized protein DICPUDRAFT_95982 [Dictyostelium purpureum]EGC29295.1 hypothetical protein DICPUDRAFT_95982 [Dictyostelium purpureum]|eukprot:XP_003294178.1 hypothetical protein DICPUDRAFT_95982 [Dictyostelium purpureum]
MEPKKSVKSNKKPPGGGAKKANEGSTINQNHQQQQQQLQQSPTSTTSSSPSSSSPVSPSLASTTLSLSSPPSPTNSSSPSTSPIISAPKPEEEELSIGEREILNKNIQDIKKKKQESDHAHKKEKQKKMEEKKKMINEIEHKKHEEEKKLKKEEEEKKKKLEKEAKEIDQKLHELAKTNPSISSTLGRNSGSSMLHGNNSLSKFGGTIGKGGGSKPGFGTISDSRILEALKKKQIQGGGSVSSNSSSGSNEGSLRKYSSHNSIGIKSGSLFRTISIPRLSKQQISVLDVFNQNGSSNSNGSSPSTSLTNLSSSLQSAPNSLASMFNAPSSGNLSTSSAGNTNGSPSLSSNRPHSINLNGSSSSAVSSASSQHLNPNGTFNFKNFIPNSTRKTKLNDFSASQRLSLKDNFFSPSNTQKRWEEYVKNILPSEQELVKQKKEQDRLREEQEQELIRQQKLQKEREKQEEQDRLDKEQQLEKERKEEEIIKTDSEQEEEEEILSPSKKQEKQEKNDGDRFITALLNKTPASVGAAKGYSLNIQANPESQFSTKTEKPAEIVNIFKYGSIDIDFSEIFGEVEDLQGFIMWTVTGFGVEERDYDDYPVLHSKDTYLVFNVSNEQKDSKLYNIHIWYGKETTLDKRGTAVMMAIQLSTHLGGAVNHFTEEQGRESELFTKYFFSDDMNGIKYKSGGADSDFFITKQLEGTKKVYLYKFEIPPVELDSCASISVRRMALSRKLIQDSSNDISWLLLNNNNSTIYIKFGTKSNLDNKVLIREFSKEIETYLSKKLKIMELNDEKEFCKLIKQLKTKEYRDKSFEYSEEDETIVNLYKTCIKSTGKLGLEQIAEEYPLYYKALSKDEVYILDCTTDIFVWCPKGISRKKVAAAKECAKVFYKEYERPAWAEIRCISSGNEPPLFKRQFKGWPLPKLELSQCVDSFKMAAKRSNISSDKFYYDFHYINFTCRDEVILPIYENLPNDKVDVYGVTLPDLQFFRLEPEEKCHFYEEDCFMVMVTSVKEPSPYAVNQNDITQTVIYWWEGVTADNRGFAMFLMGLYPIIANKFEEKGQARPSVYCITQRKEPSHFLKAFDETLIIHKGSRFDDPEICHKVYQFINEGPNTYIQQLDQNSVILNSYNVYFIRSAIEQRITIWKGQNTFTPYEELEAFAQRLDEEFQVEFYEQGQECKNFWDMLPGVKNPNPMDIDLSNDSLFKFYLSPESQVKMTRINRKYPSDLKSTECCLLDSPDVLYVWIGSNCSSSLENIVLIFVKDYCKYYSIPEESIQKVIQYNEPIEFKLRFNAWDRKEEWVDPHESRQCQVALQKTLLYRKQYEEEQQLFKEYLEYAYSLSDEDELEDFETWTLIKKGYLEISEDGFAVPVSSPQPNGFNINGHNDNDTSPPLSASSTSISPAPLLNGKNSKQDFSNVSNIVQSPKNNGLPPLPKSSKKKKFFGLFKK